MMRLRSMDVNFQCTDADKKIIVDTSERNGGTGQHVQPFELMEAAVAACMNITARARAGIKLSDVQTTVRMNWSEEGKLIFEYDYSFQGNLDDKTQDMIGDAINGCMMRKLLTHREIEFKKIEMK
ncbi:OsmC family protein [Sporomusa malonica]|uniref:OsmC-like protein n=1 Tax=Sporomusa malonica TaxID=112901 RepID=A0A1W1YAS1_9FIRM|nr:OsmC family protein [Sporomusa malonica]SMC33239.1 OsmC-like protein [Sporomusa malonica]